MLYKGHIAAGVIMAPAATFTLFAVNGVHPAKTACACIVSCFASTLTSLLPDLDSKTSRISRKLPVMPLIKIILSLFILMRVFMINDLYHTDIKAVTNIMLQIAVFVFVLLSLGHRKLFHSLWIVMGIAFVSIKFIGLNSVISSGMTTGLIMGAVSHLWGDAHTTDGIPILYPIPFIFKLRNFKSGEDDVKIVWRIMCECFAIVSIIVAGDRIKEFAINVYKLIKTKISMKFS